MKFLRKIWLSLGQSTRGLIRSAIRAEVQKVVAQVVTQDIEPTLRADLLSEVQSHVERVIDHKVVPVVTAKIEQIEQRLPRVGGPLSDILVKEIKDQIRK